MTQRQGTDDLRLTDDRRRLLERLVTAQDDERRRIARELHDETGQALATLILRLRALQEAGSLSEAKTHAARLRKGLTKTIGGLGRIARGLHPGLLDALGVGPALKRHAAEMAESLHVPIRVRTRGMGSRRLSASVEMALYRIAQEALTNVARHAGATRVDIALTQTDTAVRLVVADDGRGFGAPVRANGARGRRALGLVGIRERAAALGGVAAIASAPGRGTSVSVDLPLSGRRVLARRTRRAASLRTR